MCKLKVKRSSKAGNTLLTRTRQTDNPLLESVQNKDLPGLGMSATIGSGGR